MYWMIFLDIDLNDPEVDKAALKIQSSFRGHQARKEVKEIKEKQDNESKDKRAKTRDLEEISIHKESLNSSMDIDLNDPEVDKAALKIQSSFRGL